MIEWFRFFVVAALLVLSLSMAVVAIAGVFKFKFILNRMHAAAIIDTLVLFLGLLSVIVSYGFCAASAKVAIILLLLWVASPVSSHMIARLEVVTDKHLSDECEVEIK